jgi:hypothetical protein
VEDDVLPGTEGTEAPRPADAVPSLPDELRPQEEEVRRMVEAGAASPEELRALAAKLEEKRRKEQALWKREVKPALLKTKRLRYRPPRPEPDEPEDETEDRGLRPGLFLGAVALVGVLVLLLVAAQTSFVWLALPIVAVLVYAWFQGRGPDT